MTAVSRRKSSYDAGSVTTGIVHIGLGAFHRAHQAVYLEQWLQRNNGGDWGIYAANIRSNRTLVRQLNQQGGLYHVLSRASRERGLLTEVRSIRRAIFAGDDPSELLAQLENPATRIVSLTITEKGYHLNAATGDLDLDDPAIRHDIEHPSQPATGPGMLLEGLRRRRSAETAPFTVLCCDNMPHNGQRVAAALGTLARQSDPTLADWIDATVDFPSTMVDRIVPAMTSDSADEITAVLGHEDPAAIVCEEFSQWVVEDRFTLGRPDWEPEGVEMVADVAPWETMKLRLLNGAHSLLAYQGLLAGKTTVAEAIADPTLHRMVRDYFAEASQTLIASPGMDPASYADSLLERFANDALEHKLIQIAMDGSQKLPQRWLQGAVDNLEAGRPIDLTVEGIAAWIAHVRGNDGNGRQWQVDDPLASELAASHQRNRNPADAAAAVLDNRKVFPERLAQDPATRTGICNRFCEIVGASGAGGKQ